MCERYCADKNVALFASAYATFSWSDFKPFVEKMTLNSVTYEIIGRFVNKDWHRKPNNAVSKLTLMSKVA